MNYFQKYWNNFSNLHTNLAEQCYLLPSKLYMIEDIT